jgi:hypothetical protein
VVGDCTQTTLNRLGSVGWELVQVIAMPSRDFTYNPKTGRGEFGQISADSPQMGADSRGDSASACYFKRSVDL